MKSVTGLKRQACTIKLFPLPLTVTSYMAGEHASACILCQLSYSLRQNILCAYVYTLTCTDTHKLNSNTLREHTHSYSLPPSLPPSLSPTYTCSQFWNKATHTHAHTHTHTHTACTLYNIIILHTQTREVDKHSKTH